MKTIRCWVVAKMSAAQQRVHWSRVGEAAISGLVVVIVLSGVASNLPDSAITRGVAPLLAPVAHTGLNASWDMYAPNPPKRLDVIEVHVTMADGNDRVWTLQHDDSLPGSFTHYHWRKFKDKIVSTKRIRAGFAHWVVRELPKPSERAVRVRIILRTEMLPPPGRDGPGKTATKILYDEKLAGPQ